ncbi:hypothetical protein D3C72_1352760 [compost metagenome]
MNKLQEIREALEAATPEWKYNGNEIVSEQDPQVGIGGFLRDEDNRLAASAPEYLSYLLQLVETQAKDIAERDAIINELSKAAKNALWRMCGGQPITAGFILAERLQELSQQEGR